MATSSSRMLTLLSLLQSRRDWPGGVLAQRLEVSPRTIRRDVDRLRELGYNVHAIKGPDGGYRLDSGDELPPLLFDDDQALALAVALQTAHLSELGLEDAAARALSTVRQTMPGRVRARMDDLEFTAIDGSAGQPVDPSALLALGAAIRARVTVRFDYATPGSDVGAASAPPRRAAPHHLVANRGRWYLVAWDLDRDDWRTFRVDRLSLRTHTGARFEPRPLPGGSAAEFVAARFKGSAGVNAWPCTGSATLRAPAHAISPYLSEGTLEQVDSETTRVTIGSWSWRGLAARVAGFDADILAVQPRELRDACADLGRRLGGL